MFSIKAISLGLFEVTERFHPKSWSQYLDRANSKVVVKEGGNGGIPAL